MHTSGGSLEELKAAEMKKTVTFSPEVLGHEREITPYRKTKQQPNFSKMKKEVLQYLIKGQFDQIESYLQLYTAEQIRDFYEREAWVFFDWAIISAPTPEPLAFLIKHLPADVTLKVLTNNGFSTLGGFLYAQRIRSRNDSLTQEEQHTAFEKIKIILSINNPEINDFIDHNTVNRIKSICKTQAK